MAWFRAHEGISNDAKWPAVARRAKVKIPIVIAIWIAILDHASQAKERGDIKDFEPLVVDALYCMKDGTCQRVMEAMAYYGLIDDDRVVNWEKRQPEREDATATDRQKRKRERDKQDENATDRDVTQSHADVTQRHAPDTDSDTDILRKR